MVLSISYRYNRVDVVGELILADVLRNPFLGLLL
jgi:hypothetical protein